MRHIVGWFAVLLAAVLVLPVAQAHGGFQKQAGSVTVYVNQDPVSPLVGEQVKVSIQLQLGGNVLPGTEVELSLVDTFFDDASKDRVIHTERKVADANGSLDFSWTFEKENYFDLDLKFIDPATGQETGTGFLIQPRKIPSAGKWATVNSILLVTLAFVMVTNFLKNRPKPL